MFHFSHVHMFSWCASGPYSDRRAAFLGISRKSAPGRTKLAKIVKVSAKFGSFSAVSSPERNMYCADLCSIFLDLQDCIRLSSWISKIGRSNIMSWNFTNLTYISKCSEISNFTTTAGFSPFFANFWLWSEGRKRKRILIVERCKQCANLLHVDKCCRMNICSQK